MTQTLYKIVSEWDIGESEFVYVSREDAMDALRDNVNVNDVLIEDDTTLERLMAGGLIWIEEMEVK